MANNMTNKCILNPLQYLKNLENKMFFETVSKLRKVFLKSDNFSNAEHCQEVYTNLSSIAKTINFRLQKVLPPKNLIYLVTYFCLNF